MYVLQGGIAWRSLPHEFPAWQTVYAYFSSKDELLVDKGKLSKMWVLRRILMQMGTVDAMEFLLDKMKDSKTNEDFFATMNQ